MRTRAWWILCALLVSCTQPRTQVMVIVTGDPDVVTDARRLHFVRSGGANRIDLGVQDEDDLMVTSASWPVLVPIVPQGNDASRVFRIEVRAIDASGAEIVRSVALGSFVQGTTKALTMRLEMACRGISCSDSQQTCRGGLCRDAFIDVSMLPDYEPQQDGGMADTGPPRCGDGVRQPTEMCDTGTHNGEYLSEATPCSLDSDCPDGRLCSGFVCSGYCNTTCDAFAPYCGDATVQSSLGEACDEDMLPSGVCTEVCQLRTPACGDGFIAPTEDVCYGNQAVVVPGTARYTAIAAGDFDADMETDVVVGSNGNELVFAEGQGDGMFVVTIVNNPGAPVWDLAPIDTMDNGRLDFVSGGAACDICIGFWRVQSTPPASFGLLQSQGFPDFGAGIPLAVGVGDADRNGLLDAAASYVGDPIFGMYGITLMINNGDGTYRTGPETVLSSSDYAVRVLLAPLDVTATQGALWMITRDGALHAHAVNGDTITPNPTRNLTRRLISPVDQGGELTPVSFTGGANEVFITGTFVPGGPIESFGANSSITISWPVGGELAGAHVVDIDADGVVDDAIVVTGNGDYSIIKNFDPATGNYEGHGTFNAGFGCRVWRSAVADFNHDDAPDIAFASDCGLYILLATP